MTYRQAIDIILAHYPSAVAHYDMGFGWRILSDFDGSEYSIPLGTYCPDREQAMIVASENLLGRT
jgi:hypothetical protein